MDIKEIQQLIATFAENGLTKLELSDGDFSIKLKKDTPEVKIVQGTEPESLPVVVSPKPEVKEAPVEKDNDLIYITSPIIGTFYRAPSPDSDPYVEIGTRVKKGDVLCIVEAMKIMNEIESEYDGVIVKIFPQNAESVEYGQKLFALKTD